MESFKDTGRGVFNDFKADNFSAVRCDDDQIAKNISTVYNKYGRIIDPHTACGFQDICGGVNVVVSTAHPAKFPELIMRTVGVTPKSDSLEVLKAKPIVRLTAPANSAAVRKIIEENALK